MSERLTVVFPIFPGLTQLDFTGPLQVLSRVAGVETIVASRAGGSVTASGLTFADLPKLADIPRCDVICVPGGNVAEAMADRALLAEIRRLAGTARYVTSVCTGSLLLGVTGQLAGKRAACHWAYRPLLAKFGAIPDAGRVVTDGNVITGGGVTAGIDFALTLVATMAGPLAAQTVQLALEYAPAPPFDAGRPDTAPAEVVAQLRDRFTTALEVHAAAIDRAMKQPA